MKDDSDDSRMNNIKNDLGYTGFGDKSSKSKNFFSLHLSKRVAETKNRIVNEALPGQRIAKNIIPSNVFDIYTRSEILPGFKLSGHNKFHTGASNLIAELYKKYRTNDKIEMLLINFIHSKRKYQVKF